MKSRKNTEKMLKYGNPDGRGGKRAGAGRPRKLVTILREKAIISRDSEAEKSLQFCIDLRNDLEVLAGVRLEAAKEIMNRVWGKPKQQMELSGQGGGPIKVQVEIQVHE